MKKKQTLKIIGIVIGFLFLFQIFFFLNEKGIKNQMDNDILSDETKEICFENSCIQAEVVDSQAERSLGMMYREQLDNDKGMLFVFEESGNYPFWMKNTLIPLDMIWVTKDLKIVHVETAIPCMFDPCRSYNPNKDALYVVEVNANYTKINNIQIGDNIRIN